MSLILASCPSGQDRPCLLACWNSVRVLSTISGKAIPQSCRTQGRSEPGASIYSDGCAHIPPHPQCTIARTPYTGVFLREESCGLRIHTTGSLLRPYSVHSPNPSNIQSCVSTDRHCNTILQAPRRLHTGHCLSSRNPFSLRQTPTEPLNPFSKKALNRILPLPGKCFGCTTAVVFHSHLEQGEGHHFLYFGSSQTAAHLLLVHPHVQVRTQVTKQDAWILASFPLPLEVIQ